MDIKIYQMLEFINSRLNNLEKNIAKLDEKLDFSISLQRNHLIRIKNGNEIDDNMILLGRPYNDISPLKAFEIFSKSNLDFYILDVSSKNYTGEKINEAISIPLEELNIRFVEIPSKTIPLLIISENGLKSIQASELLVKKGFLNVNNISGGHDFWPGHQNNSKKSNPVPPTL